MSLCYHPNQTIGYIKLRGNDNDFQTRLQIDLKKCCLNKATKPKNKFRYDFRE